MKHTELLQSIRDAIAVKKGYHSWENAMSSYKTGNTTAYGLQCLENEFAMEVAKHFCKLQRDISFIKLVEDRKVSPLSKEYFEYKNSIVTNSPLATE